MADLVIAGVMITQDVHGRYNLNALHQASDYAANHHKVPGEWLRRKSTKALISELKTQVVNLPLEVVHGGEHAGTYAHELLAVEYAGWISPAFRLKVNQAFIDSRTMPTLPKVHDHRTQIAIDTLVRLDAVEYDLATQKQLVTQTQDTMVTMLRLQQWMTIRQYVFVHALSHQVPPARQREYAAFLGNYCLENGIPMYKALTAEAAWPDERTYYTGAMQDTLFAWLARIEAQAPLQLVKQQNA